MTLNASPAAAAVAQATGAEVPATINTAVTGAEKEVKTGAETGSEKEVVTEATRTAAEAGAVEANAAAEEEAPLTLYMGDEEITGADPAEETPELLRSRLAELLAENTTLKAGGGKPAVAQAISTEPVKPGFWDENIGGDPEKFATALTEYNQLHGAWEKQATEQAEAKIAHQGAISKSVTEYQEKVKGVMKTFPKYLEVEAVVIAALPPAKQVAILTSGISNPELVTYALGQNKELLTQVQAENDPVKFGVLLANISNKVKLAPKVAKVINSETELTGSAVNTHEARLAAAEKKAVDTGDRTEVINIKREIAAAKEAKAK